MRGRLKLRYNIVLGSRFSRGSRLHLRGRLVEYISHVHAIRWKQALRESSYRKWIKDPLSLLLPIFHKSTANLTGEPVQWPRERTGSGESDSASNLLQSWRMKPISAQEKVKITGFKTLTIPPKGSNAGWFAPFSFHWNDNSVMQRDHIKLRLQ